MAVKTYDPDNVSVTFGGVPIRGYSPDSVITFEFDNDMFTKQVGCTGEVARSRSNDQTGTATISLMSTSTSNNTFNIYYQLDVNSNAGVAPLIVVDKNSGETLNAVDAWIQKPPPMSKANEVGNKEWVLATGQASAVYAGIEG